MSCLTCRRTCTLYYYLKIREANNVYPGQVRTVSTIKKKKKKQVKTVSQALFLLPFRTKKISLISVSVVCTLWNGVVLIIILWKGSGEGFDY